MTKAKDVTETPEEIIERLAGGLEMEARFVTFSPRSQHAEPEGGAKLFPSLNWKITIFGKGVGQIDCSYSQGIAHCPAYKRFPPSHEAHRPAISWEIENGREVHEIHSTETGWRVVQGDPIDPPSLVAVLASLAIDADVLDYASFADWADCFGLSSGSIKGRKTYDQCVENSLKLRATFGTSDLEELMDAARDL